MKDTLTVEDALELVKYLAPIFANAPPAEVTRMLAEMQMHSHVSPTGHRHYGDKGAAMVLKVLHFLSMQLAAQLEQIRREDPPVFQPVLPDTVLHEHGIRHNPALCQHCKTL